MTRIKAKERKKKKDGRIKLRFQMRRHKEKERKANERTAKTQERISVRLNTTGIKDRKMQKQIT